MELCVSFWQSVRNIVDKMVLTRRLSKVRPELASINQTSEFARAYIYFKGHQKNYVIVSAPRSNKSLT